jgi:hypothetical protein
MGFIWVWVLDTYLRHLHCLEGAGLQSRPHYVRLLSETHETYETHAYETDRRREST